MVAARGPGHSNRRYRIAARACALCVASAPRSRHRRAPRVRVIAARRAERLWELTGADGGGGGVPRADAAAAGGLEYREHRAGAADRAGTGED